MKLFMKRKLCPCEGDSKEAFQKKLCYFYSLIQVAIIVIVPYDGKLEKKYYVQYCNASTDSADIFLKAHKSHRKVEQVIFCNS